jgi:hypothetical protein
MMNNSRGSILVEALIAGVIITATFLMYLSHLHRESIANGREKMKVAILTVERNLNQTLLNDEAWKQTFDAPINNSSFNCARCSHSRCSTSASLSFTPLDAGGNPVLRGLDALGNLCDPGTQSCYVEANVNWRPICPTGAPCWPSEGEITVQWVPGPAFAGKETSLRFGTNQSIIKNFQDQANTFTLATAVNANVGVDDCPCGTRTVKSTFRLDHPQPGSYTSIELCQPKHFSPRGTAAYRLAFCGNRGDTAPCTPACESSYNLIQSIPYNVPADGSFPGYPASFGVCENPHKAPRTANRVSLTVASACPAGWTEESSTNLNVGGAYEIVRVCSQPR